MKRMLESVTSYMLVVRAVDCELSVARPSSDHSRISSRELKPPLKLNSVWLSALVKLRPTVT